MNPDPQRRHRPRTIAIDFDGVIHRYSQGWQGVPNIYDPPVPGVLEWMHKVWSETNFAIVIHSTRANSIVGTQAIKQWLFEHDPRRRRQDSIASTFKGWSETSWMSKVEVTAHKPKAVIYIDDRAFRFEGEGTLPPISELGGLAETWQETPGHGVAVMNMLASENRSDIARARKRYHEMTGNEDPIGVTALIGWLDNMLTDYIEALDAKRNALRDIDDVLTDGRGAARPAGIDVVLQARTVMQMLRRLREALEIDEVYDWMEENGSSIGISFDDRRAADMLARHEREIALGRRLMAPGSTGPMFKVGDQVVSHLDVRRMVRDWREKMR